MADLVFRRATLDDYDAVLDISEDIFQGMDYIMNEYKTLMSGNYNGFLAELDGKAIAFVMCSTQLNNRKLCVKAGRVREGWRGRGIYGRLMAFQLQEMKRTYPTLETEEFSSNEVNVSLHKLYESDEYKEFCKRPFLNFCANPSRSTSEPITSTVTIRDIGVEGLARVMLDNGTCGAIFPTRVFINWEMYDPLPSEISFIAKMEPGVLVAVDEDDKIKSLSTLGSLRTIKGRLYIVQFHFRNAPAISTATKMMAILIRSHIGKLRNISDNDQLVLSADETYRHCLRMAARMCGLCKISQFTSEHIGFYRKV